MCVVQLKFAFILFFYTYSDCHGRTKMPLPLKISKISQQNSGICAFYMRIIVFSHRLSFLVDCLFSAPNENINNLAYAHADCICLSCVVCFGKPKHFS